MDMLLTEYNIAWMVYLLGFLVVYQFWSWFLQLVPIRFLRQLFKGMLAVLLLTPAVSERASDWLVPAWLNLFYAVLLDQPEVIGNTLLAFTLAGLLMLIILSLDAGWFRYRRRRS